MGLVILCIIGLLWVGLLVSQFSRPKPPDSPMFTWEDLSKKK